MDKSQDSETESYYKSEEDKLINMMIEENINENKKKRRKNEFISSLKGKQLYKELDKVLDIENCDNKYNYIEDKIILVNNLISDTNSNGNEIEEALIIDTGANIAITNRKTLKSFAIEEKKYDKPFWIRFGNNTTYLVTTYANFGDVLGDIAIVEDAPRSLLSVYWLTDRGYSVEFIKNTAIIRNKEEQIIFLSKADKNTKLWHIKFKDLINIDSSQKQLNETRNMNLQNKLKRIKLVNRINSLEKVRQRQSTKRTRISKVIINKVHSLHKNLYHAASPEAMVQALKAGAWDGIDEDITPEIIRAVYKRVDCIPCKLAKSNKLPTLQGSGIQRVNVGETISVDVIGPVSPMDINGYTSFFLLRDQASKYVHSVLVKRKTELKQVLEDMISFYKRYGYEVKNIRTDSGSVEISKDIEEWARTKNINMLPAGVENQNQNPVERDVQIVIKGIAAMLVDQLLVTANYWSFALKAFVQAWNCTSNVTTDYKESPIEIVTGVIPDISQTFQYQFGSAVAISRTVNNKDRWRFSTKCEYGYIVGTSAINGAVEVIIPSRNKFAIFLRNDVRLLNLNVRPISPKEREELLPVIGEADNSITFKGRNISERLSKKRLDTDDLINDIDFDDNVVNEIDINKEKLNVEKRIGDVINIGEYVYIPMTAWSEYVLHNPYKVIFYISKGYVKMVCKAYIGGKAGKALKVTFPICSDTDTYNQSLQWFLVNAIKELPKDSVELTKDL
jgi:hypothetical protein